MRSSPRTRPRLRRLLLGLGVALALLVAAEGVLRLVLGAPTPPPALQVGHGGVGAAFEPRGALVAAAFQPPGLQVVFEPERNARRFAVLGGSSVQEGRHGVGRGREFTALLEATLGVEGLNLGSPGLDSGDLVVITRELLAWPPAALVVYAGHNDLGNVLMGRHHPGVGGALVARVRHALGWLQLYDLLRAAFTRGGPGRASPLALSAADRAAIGAAYAENLDTIAGLAEARGVPLVLVVPVSNLCTTPEPQACEGEGCPEVLYREGAALRGTDPVAAAALLRRARDADGLALRADSAMQDSVRAVAAAHPGVVLVDTERGLPREPGLDVPAADLFSDVLHFSVEGHRAMAELIAPALAEALGREGPPSTR
ncbi:MAG: SGNH/GDSL hydrolase family protein [Pseudomonadota bacterium]